MSRMKSLIKTSFLGGLTVILPVAILVFVFKWIFGVVARVIQPLTNLILIKSNLREIMADLLALAIIITVCFIVGVIVKTQIGRFIHTSLENSILKFAPGYSLIKETVMQFLGRKKPPFSSVALVQVFGNETMLTAFVTDEHSDGSYTVFVPTGPNPTSGNIYHLESRFVHQVDVPVEDVIRSIISCGAGSAMLIDAYRK
ncbi:MAG: DUF502 domain-containing protein [Desulfobacteraceae bacterium]|nr:DUF502 domain-containing protein [Pseudomonadota bacterium]MBU4463429.1 DUF502 domain-containing protein [Pseudomonadota bacterium]MCG2755606.1 DUF502 domain-containing protein [Desulfobacteraceae bacterium]